MLVAFVAACSTEGGGSTSEDAGQPDGGGDAAPDASGSLGDAGVPLDAAPDAAGDAGIDALVPAPTAVTALPGNGLAIVGWQWPGIGPVTYSVTSEPGGIVVTTPTPKMIVTGLTNGVGYRFTVVATTLLGSSSPSAPSDPVVPAFEAGAPDAPSGVTAVAGNASAVVSWEAPPDHGSPITRYTVRSEPDGITVTTTETSVEVPGLTNGKSYTFGVVATNAVGSSALSSLSNGVVPAGPPGAPVNVVATRGNGSATITWAAPNDNGSPITGYTVTSNPYTPPVNVTTTSALVTGLTNGTSYTFTVKATNAKGTGPASAVSNVVVPAGLPYAPTGVHATHRNGAAVVYWTAPNANGDPIIRYTVTTSPGGATMTTSDTAARVTGLTNGASYTFTVTATNGVGVGPASAASNTVIPSATGCAELEFTVTAGMAYSFNGLGGNPPITACRGQTLIFHLSNVSDQHPFFIRNVDGTLASGVTNNGATGTIDVVWNVPASQAAGAYYQCLIHPSMTNVFELQ